MRIGIIGASGFIGRHLARAAISKGHTAVGFSRSVERAHETSRHGMEMRKFDLTFPLETHDLDAIVNLAGESVFGLWTSEKRKKIMESRVKATRHVVDSLKANRGSATRVLVNGSANGYYGDRGEEMLDENATHGEGFLSEVTQAWEREAHNAGEVDVRVVMARFGMVLGRDGGAMKVMKPVFRMGLGGKLGDGRQWMSCIHVEDAAGAILFALDKETIAGAMNVVMPEAVRNADFTRAMARAARRPAIFGVPRFAMKAVLGEMSSMMLNSERVVPGRLRDAGYVWRYASIEEALEEVFNRGDAEAQRRGI